MVLDWDLDRVGESRVALTAAAAENKPVLGAVLTLQLCPVS